MRPLRDWPWSAKLAGLMVALSLLPIAIVTGYSEVMARRDFVRDSGSRNQQQAINTASLISRYLDDIVGDVRILAGSPAAIEVLADRSAEMSPRLDALMRTIKDAKQLEMIQVIGPDGTIIACTDRARVGGSRLTAPFFQAALAGQARIHDPRFVADDRAVHINASVPVFGPHNRIVGVAAARIPLDDLDRLVAGDTNYGGVHEYGLLWDEQGIVLSSPAHPERRFRPLAPLDGYAVSQLTAEERFGPETARLLAVAGTGEALVARARWRLSDPSASPHVRAQFDEGAVQVTVVPVPNTRWTYAIVTPESAALASVRGETARNLALAFVTAMFAVCTALMATGWVSRPLSRVGDAARALAAGDMTRRTHLRGRDEIGQLAATFDSMADSLAEKDMELREYADSLERRVAERTAELTGLLSAVPDLIFKVSADGRLVDYVPAKGQELGLPGDQFLGRPISDVLPVEVSDSTVDRIHRALAGEDVEPHEYRQAVAGEDRHFEARVSPSGQGAVVVLVRDITERRRNEERTRFLARAAATLSSSLDYGSTVETLAALAVPFLADLCVVDLCEQGHIRCGAVAATTPQRQALAVAARQQYPVHPDGPHPVAAAMRGETTLYPECSPDKFAHLINSSDHEALVESIAPRSLLVVPLTARGQTFGSMLCIRLDGSRRYTQADLALAQDLADRAGIALDNARLYREVQESNRLKDEFLGTVSHELRTPLNAVLGWAQVLKSAGARDPAQAARALDAIERNAQAQAELVEDLLDTSRVVSGKLRIELLPTRVGDLVQAVVESFRPLATARGVQLAVSTGDNLVPIMADAARLQQVIGNLVSNALKFTPLGGHVAVTARRVNGSIEIVVADTGAGIAPEFLPFVFDRFRQGDSTTTRAHGGLGLGLAIARHLVEQHGGTIRAQSDGEQQGATFTIVLPIRESPASPVADAPAHPAPVLAGTRVLVVDDETDTRSLMQVVIGAAGAEVETAISAEGARRAIAARRPQVLVSDIGMPGEDGYALIRSIREADERAGLPRLPSIALTAYAREDDRIRALAAGFDRHVTKPVDPAHLLRTIADLAGGG